MISKRLYCYLQHPVTTEYNTSENIIETVKAVSQLKDYQIIWLWPNADAGSEFISKALRVFGEENQMY